MNNNYFGIYVQALLAKNAATTLQKQLKNIKDLQVKVTPTFGKINKVELNRVNKDLETQLLNKLKDAGKIEIKPNVNQEAARNTISNVNKISSSLRKDLIPSVQDTGRQFSLLDNFVGKSTETMNGLLGVVSKVAVWGIATSAVYGTKRALKELFQTYVEIEDKLISIQRVSDNLDISKIFSGSYEYAQKYGATLMDMLNSTEEIARSYSGLNEKQVLAAAQAGVLASTIAEMKGEDAVGTIIAVSNAYGLAIENGERLIDMLNEVDNNFSVTSANIASAWEKSAATAKTFGVEIHNLTGYIAAISTVTQESGDVIGNGLKTIFSRITTMKAATDAVKSAGVEIYDSMGKVRAVQDILKDLAENWDGLTDSQRQNISVQVAGRYQLTRFLALMNNWNIATEASAAALNSEGSAARENAVYLESYKAKLNQLNNAQARLAETINNSNMAGIGKTWIDLKIAATELTNSFFKLADATTVIIGSIVVMIGYLAKTANGYKLLKNALMFVTTEQKAAAIATNIQTNGLLKNRIATVLATTSTNLNTAALTLNRRAQAAAGFEAQATAVKYTVLARASKLAAGAVGLLSKAFTTIPGMAFVALIGFIAKGLIDMASANSEAQKKIETTNASLRESGQIIDDTISKYDKLRDKVKTGLAPVGTDEYQEYLDLQEELIEKFPEYENIIKDETKSLQELKDAREQALIALKNENDERAKRIRENAKFEPNKRDTFYVGEKPREQKIDWYNPLEWIFGDRSQWSIFADEEVFVDAKEAVKGYIDELDKVDEKFSNAGTNRVYLDYIKSLADGYIKTTDDAKKFFEIYDKFGNDIYNSDDALQIFSDTLVNDFGYGLDEAKQKTAELNDKIKDLAEIPNTLKEASESMAEFNKNSGNSLNIFFGVADETTEAIDNMLQYIKLFGTESDITKTKANELSNSLMFMGEKVFENGDQLLNNVDTLKMISETLKIAQSDEETYAEAVANGTMYVANGYKTEFEAMRTNKLNELTVYKNWLIAMKNGEYERAQAIQKGANSAGAVWAKQETNYKKHSGVLASIANNIATWISNAWKGITGQNKDNTKTNTYSVDEIKKMTGFDSWEKAISDVQSQIDSISNIKIVETTIDGFKKISDAAKGTAKDINYLDLAEAALLRYKSAVEAVENELKILQERNKQLTEGSVEWFNNIAAQQSVIDRYKKAIQEYISQIEIQLKNNNLEADDKAKLINKIQDLRLEYEKLNTTLHDLTETQEKYYANQISDRLNLIKKMENERHKEALANIKSEREAFQKQINEQLALMKKASQARNYEKELNKLQEKRLDILNQISRLEGDDSRLARSRILDLTKELKDVEEQIEDLNYERSNELREDALDDLSTQLDDYYDNLEDLENNRNELILSSLEDAKSSLDNLGLSLDTLKNELVKWSSNLDNFNNWFKTFDSLIGTIPVSNIVSSIAPINSVDANGNTNTTSIVFNISGATPENAQNIGNTIVDNLKKAGIITSGNNNS